MKGNGTKPSATAEKSVSSRIDTDVMAGIGRQESKAAEAASLQEAVRRAMIEEELTQKDVAQQTSIGAAALNQWLSDRYAGDNTKIEAKVQQWLRSRGERVSMAQLQPAIPVFFPSETATKIINHLRYTHSLQNMLTIFGTPGVGKTTAIRYYQRAYPNVWIATMAAHTTGVAPVLRSICDVVGSARGSHVGGPSGHAREICVKLKGTRGLLVIDEAHHLTPQSLDAIRAIHDATEVGLVLVGGVELETKIQTMPQFYSRVGLRLFVTKVLKSDINAQLDAWSIDKGESRRFLADLASKPGGLRGVTKTLTLASVLATTAGETLNIDHIKDAAAVASQATGDE